MFFMSLSELREYFRHVGDGLGLGIDAGIMETVVALTANGIPTASSCEGHADRGLPYPWVAISHRQPNRALEGEVDPLQGALKVLNEPVYPRLEALLKEFYAQRKYPVQLNLVRLGLADSRLMPDVGDNHRRTDLLKPRQAEMQAFTAFLLERARQSGK